MFKKISYISLRTAKARGIWDTTSSPFSPCHISVTRSSTRAPCSRRAQPGRWGLLLPPVMISPWKVQAARTSNLPWAHVAEALCRQGWPRRWGFPERWGVCLPMQDDREMQVWSLGRGDLLGLETASRSSILAWETPWTEEPGKLQSMGLPRVGHDWMAKHTHVAKKTRFPFL